MTKRVLGLLIAAAVLLGAAGPAAGQEGGVVITSVPSGAVVELRGDVMLRGVTPWRLDRPIGGTFEIRAYMGGYNEWRGFTALSPTRVDSISITLSRKTPLSAGLRSALVPGWGQFYTGQELKGTAFLVVEAGLAAGLLWSDAKRHDAENDYEDALRAYQAADQVDEIEEAYAERLRTFDDYEKWHERRKRWAYAAAAVWLINVLDATLLMPSTGPGGFAAAETDEPGFFATVGSERTEFGYHLRF
ncbi:MAG: hypothetical protein GF405_07365 [Candidatus Eisenbacteria bacterium]|nr:hypothetical protein [Candidatus Eisenbacteria bacterium]